MSSNVCLWPGEFDAAVFITIIAPKTAKVRVDGTAVLADSWAPVSKKYLRAWLKVAPGVHHVRSDAAVGVEVYGYDQYVSYGYPAGMKVGDAKLISASW